jgi:DNA-binding transcriptional LysR family regulator
LNLTKAAERLNISQPALSRSIISIERDYGFAIFDRRPTGLTLTNIGKNVVAQARLVLERFNSYDHTLRLYGQGEEGKVAFGIAPQLASLLLSLDD